MGWLESNDIVLQRKYMGGQHEDALSSSHPSVYLPIMAEYRLSCGTVPHTIGLLFTIIRTRRFSSVEVDTISMARHARSLSATITNNIQASAHVIAEASHDAVNRSTNAVQHILHYDQLPEWMKVDPYIKHGYRRPLNSFRDCYHSLFYLHNESINIWSHLVPAFFYIAFSLGLCFQTFLSGIEVSTADGAFFQVYILCTAGCLLLSAIYHCTNSHSEQHISRYLLKVDYFGILLSIIGTNVSAAYFGLYGNLLLQVFYIVFFLVCAALVFQILLRRDIDGPSAVFRRYFPFSPLLT